MTARARVVAAGVVLLVGIGLSLMAIGWLLGRSPTPTVVVDAVDGWVAGGVELDGSVIVSVVSSEWSGQRTTLLRLDPLTGEETQRAELAVTGALDDLATVDGDLVLRVRGRLPDVPATEFWWPESALRQGELWLVVVDGETLTPLRQYQLPPTDDGPNDRWRAHEPLVLIDGEVWLLGIGMGQGPIDVRTGEYRTRYDDVRGRIGGVLQLDGEVAVVWGRQVRIFDLESGQFAREWFVRDYLEPDDPFLRLASFRVHGADVWLLRPHFDQAEGRSLIGYDRIDLLTGRAEPGHLDDDQLASWSFESAGSRWELVDHALVTGPRTPDEPADRSRWRRLDPSTGEVLAEFHLGGWEPRFATADHLWVSRDLDDGGGQRLARLPLSSL